MSRSYKKHPICSDGKAGSTKRSKRIANSKVRNTEGKYNRKEYKKLFCSWNIHDYISRWTWFEAKKAYEEDSAWRKRFPTIKEFHRYWYKCYRAK